ncbi:MAG: hypothetical protein OHK93_003700 [Ramalina farinacea]|uniref:NACHT domain-containing protein n=1 Tax=Ramalina farinacea TaxID=258253 RepID=A0AA43QTQ3_9LECA|nr:hypothetical protein [Ramalina farinacea]
MGGLVIKRAYILAKQRQDLRRLTDRVKAIVFLATPHRGADLARVFSKLLSISGGARPFVEDLHRNSLATQSINEEFPNYCQDLKLVSFYETLPTFGKSLIVEQDQATLGYANERREFLNANHRDVCKYDSRDDPNYKTMRNALASILCEIQDNPVLSKQKIDGRKRRQLDAILGAFDTPEDDLLSADSLRMGGSCEWLINKGSFQHWVDHVGLPIYWINGKPAAGKTVLASKVITHLRSLDKPCDFFFFHYGNKGVSNISSFLLSMARQIAMNSEEMIDIVLDVFGGDDRLCKADHRIIWRKVFLDAILKVKMKECHYWVIDALDECTNEAGIVALLTKLVEVSPIRILVTSRNQIENCFGSAFPQRKIHMEQVLEADSKSDIALYLKSNISRLPSIDADGQQSILQQILEKSAGCFLWVNLVLQELANVKTSTDIAKVMAEVPTDMNELFARILDMISAASYGKELARAILTWVTCSMRPLKSAELHDALQIDLGEQIDVNIEESIRACCGQFVYVDAQSQVQMIHLTARDFLLRPELDSEFAVDEKIGHRRLLLSCLVYLNGDEMKGRRRRGPVTSNIPKQRSPFASYASNYLFEHISHTRFTDRETLYALARFFGSANVQTWVEYITKHSDLHRLIQTGKALDRFLRQKWSPELRSCKEWSLLQSWAVDLVQLVMKFGKNLAGSPSAIFDLIPPFCPPASAPWKQFGSSARGIKVFGLRAQTWDDCLSTIVNPHEQFSSLACSKSLFVIGTFRGKITFYNQTTCQEIGSLEQEEPVRGLLFGNTGSVLVSSGFKCICVWNAETRERLCMLQAPQQAMSLAITDNDKLLLGALKDHRLKSWDLTSCSLTEDVDWKDGLEEMTKLHYRRPITAAFGMDAQLLAVIYKGQDVLLWDLESGSLYDTYSRECGAGSMVGRPYGSAGVRCLCFGAAESANLLCAAYGDGELVLFDTSTGSVMERIVAFAHVLVCSPDGSTLASADPSGTIQLFQIETLGLLYRIESVEPGIQGLAFNGDSSRLLDIRSSRCRVWEPPVLQNHHAGDGSRRYSASDKKPDVISLDSTEDCVLITSIACHHNGIWLFGGKEDGTVHVYDLKSDSPSTRLFSHAQGVAILHVEHEAKSNTLASIDSSSRVMIHRVKSHGQSLAAGDVIFDHRADSAVNQLILQEGLGRMLISSAKSDVLWSMSGGDPENLTIIQYSERRPYQWASHPTNSEHLIFVESNIAHLYHWNALDRLTVANGILLEGSILPELNIRSITPCFEGTMLATTFSESLAPHSESRLILWNSTEISPDAVTAKPVPRYHHLADQIELTIGSTAAANEAKQSQRLVFLHRSNWVCSTDLHLSQFEQYVRHFFFPADWPSANVERVMKVTNQGDIIVVKQHEIAVIKNGLLLKESVEFDNYK